MYFELLGARTKLLQTQPEILNIFVSGSEWIVQIASGSSVNRPLTFFGGL